MESAASPEFFSEKQHSKTFAEESPTPIVWRDKRNADPEVFASINSCRPAAVKALGHMAVFDLRTLNGVPALAFARWSHPTLFAAFPIHEQSADHTIPPCCSRTDPRRLRRCLLWCRHRGSTFRIAIGAIRSSSDAQARLLPRRSCRHGCRTG